MCVLVFIKKLLKLFWFLMNNDINLFFLDEVVMFEVKKLEV